MVYVVLLLSAKNAMNCFKGIESYIEVPEKTLDFDPFDNTEDKDNKSPPLWRR